MRMVSGSGAMINGALAAEGPKLRRCLQAK